MQLCGAKGMKSGRAETRRGGLTEQERFTTGEKVTDLGTGIRTP